MFSTTSQRFFARAQDNTGAFSNPVSTTVTVNQEPVEPIIIDDGDPGFSAPGFRRATDGGHDRDYLYGGVGIGSGATWRFTGLAPGASYDLAATWVAHANRATDAPYRINGSDPVRVNQEQTPNDFVHLGTPWERLGTFTADASGVLEVRLGVDANEYVIADAIFASEPGVGS
jgi:hypothetical protein